MSTFLLPAQSHRGVGHYHSMHKRQGSRSPVHHRINTRQMHVFNLPAHLICVSLNWGGRTRAATEQGLSVFSCSTVTAAALNEAPDWRWREGKTFSPMLWTILRTGGHLEVFVTFFKLLLSSFWAVCPMCEICWQPGLWRTQSWRQWGWWIILLQISLEHAQVFSIMVLNHTSGWG